MIFSAIFYVVGWLITQLANLLSLLPAPTSLFSSSTGTAFAVAYGYAKSFDFILPFSTVVAPTIAFVVFIDGGLLTYYVIRWIYQKIPLNTH